MGGGGIPSPVGGLAKDEQLPQYSSLVSWGLGWGSSYIEVGKGNVYEGGSDGGNGIGYSVSMVLLHSGQKYPIPDSYIMVHPHSQISISSPQAIVIPRVIWIVSLCRYVSI